MIVGRPTILVKRELLKNLKVDFDIELDQSGLAVHHGRGEGILLHCD
jgi:hypothetical protein